VDIAQRGAAEELAAWAGELDILVNNAGAIPGGDLPQGGRGNLAQGLDLKLFGYINLTRAVYAGMKKRKRGVIVNIIGAAGEKMNAAYIAGSAANASLMAFTRALGGASHADGIRVIGINPGPVATDRLISLHKQQAAAKFGDESRYEELFAACPSGGRPRPRKSRTQWRSSPPSALPIRAAPSSPSTAASPTGARVVRPTCRTGTDGRLAIDRYSHEASAQLSLGCRLMP